jgi:hypothetical protein
VREGLGWGALLAVFAVVFAVLGLTPSLAWIPELPLLGAAALIPLAILAVAGYRAGWRAASLAGAIGGAAGGIAYVVYGKSMVNVAVGLVSGTVGGALIGAASGRWALRRGRSKPG